MDLLVLFLWSVIDHWGSLMTGGIIIAIIVVIEHYLGKSLTWGRFLAVALLFFTYASYLAWDDEHTKLRNTEQQLATEREQSTTVRDQNARKRRSEASASGSIAALCILGHLPHSKEICRRQKWHRHAD